MLVSYNEHPLPVQSILSWPWILMAYQRLVLVIVVVFSQRGAVSLQPLCAVCPPVEYGSLYQCVVTVSTDTPRDQAISSETEISLKGLVPCHTHTHIHTHTHTLTVLVLLFPSHASLA